MRKVPSEVMWSLRRTHFIPWKPSMRAAVARVMLLLTLVFFFFRPFFFVTIFYPTMLFVTA